MHQQNQNYREPLTCTDVGTKDRGKSIFSIGLFEIETNIVGTRMPRPKMGWFKFCLYVRAHKNQTSLNLWTHRFNQILSLRNLFRVFRSLQVVLATERCNNTLPGLWCVKTLQHIARPLRSFSSTHLIPMLSTFHHVWKETKGRKSWVKHNTFFASSKAVNNNKKSFFVRFLYL